MPAPPDTAGVKQRGGGRFALVCAALGSVAGWGTAGAEREAGGIRALRRPGGHVPTTGGGRCAIPWGLRRLGENSGKLRNFLAVPFPG